MLDFSILKMERKNKYKVENSKKIIPVLPWLPIPDDEPSELLKLSLYWGRYPSLLKNQGWRKAIPFKVGIS